MTSISCPNCKSHISEWDVICLKCGYSVTPEERELFVKEQEAILARSRTGAPGKRGRNEAKAPPSSSEKVRSLYSRYFWHKHRHCSCFCHRGDFAGRRNSTFADVKLTVNRAFSFRRSRKSFGYRLNSGCGLSFFYLHEKFYHLKLG